MGLDNPLHIAFLVIILLLVFGARRLPEIGRSLGSGMREFKQSVTGEDNQQPTLSAAQQQQQPAPQVPTAQPAAAVPQPAAAPPPVAQPVAVPPPVTQPVAVPPPVAQPVAPPPPAAPVEHQQQS